MRQTGRQAKIIDPYCPTFLRGPPPVPGPAARELTTGQSMRMAGMRASEALSHAPQGTYGSVAAALSSSRSSLATSPHPATDFPAARRPPTGRQTVPVWSVGQGATGALLRLPGRLCGNQSPGTGAEPGSATSPSLRAAVPAQQPPPTVGSAPAVGAVEAVAKAGAVLATKAVTRESRDHSAGPRHRWRRLGHMGPDARALGPQTATAEAP